MTWANASPFICYSVAALVSIAFGLVYLARSTFMPYHRDALSTSWEQLDKPLQALRLGLIKVAGGGFLTSGISPYFCFRFPFGPANLGRALLYQLFPLRWPSQPFILRLSLSGAHLPTHQWLSV